MKHGNTQLLHSLTLGFMQLQKLKNAFPLAANVPTQGQAACGVSH